MSTSQEELFKGMEFLINGGNSGQGSAESSFITQDSLEKEISTRVTGEGEEDTDTNNEGQEDTEGKNKSTGKEDKEPEGIDQDELEKELIKNKSSKKEEEEEESEEEESTDEVENEGGNSVYKVLSELLKEQGVVDVDFDSPEGLYEAISSEIVNGIEGYKESIPDVIKHLLDNYEDGVPLDELIGIKSEEIRINNISEDSLSEDKDLQKKLYKEYLKTTTKFSDSKIDKLINTAEDLEELEDNAKEALEGLKSLNAEKEQKLKLRVEAEKKAQEQQTRQLLNTLKETVDNTKEIIPGLKISDKEKQQLFKMVTTPAEVRGDMAMSAAMLAREKDPIGFELKLNYFLSKGFFDGKFDDVVKKAESNTAKKLEKSIEAEAKKLMNKSGKGADVEENDGENKILKAWKSTKKPSGF